MKLDDTILGPVRGDAATALAYLDRPDAKDRAYVEELWRWAAVAGVDPAIAYCWFLVETADATSIRWNRDKNPGGIGIPADSTVQPFVIPSGEAAARIHVQCLYSIVERELHPGVALWPEALVWMQRVWLPKVNDPRFPPVARLTDLDVRYEDSTGDLQATWAWGFQLGQPAQAAVNKSRLVFPSLSDQGATDMPNPQPPLEIALTPAGRPNRPGLIMPSPSYITVHEVGNLSPGANEDMHRNFVHNGGGEHNVSFHFVVGPTKAIQLFELDQVTWHASDGFNGTGNRDSVAIETIQIGDFDRTLWHLAWLIAEIIKNPRRFATTAARAWDFSPARIVQHNHWAPDNKNCPQFIRDRGLWPLLMARVNGWLRAEGAPTYAKPSIPAFLKDEAQLATGDDRKIGKTPVIAFRRLWTAKKETARLQHGGAKAPEIGPKIKKGESFLGEFVYRSTGEWWVLTRWGSRIRMRDLDYPPFFADELKAA